MSLRPSYRTGRAQYDIDRCEPQKDAILSGKICFHALARGHYPGIPIPAHVLPGLNSIGFWDAAGRPDWGLDEHRNEGIEIMYLETGSMDFTMEGRKFMLRAGNFTVTRPWQLHKLGAPNIGPGRLHWAILDVGVRRPRQDWRWPEWIVLTQEDLSELTRKLQNCDCPVWTATPAIMQSFRQIAHSIEIWQEPYSVSRLTANLNQLLVNLLETLGDEASRNGRQDTSLRRVVDSFLRDLEDGRLNTTEPWPLNRMAAHCGVGVTTFAKYCRELVNTGPVEFLNRIRLDNAARQLRANPSLPVTEVALTNGFNSSQYFATAFARRFRASPSRYREGN